MNAEWHPCGLTKSGEHFAKPCRGDRAAALRHEDMLTLAKWETVSGRFRGYLTTYCRTETDYVSAGQPSSHCPNDCINKPRSRARTSKTTNRTIRTMLMVMQRDARAASAIQNRFAIYMLADQLKNDTSACTKMT